MSQINEKMITINGKTFSESTIVEALKKHCDFQKQYQFQTGDIAIVCDNKNAWWRIIIEMYGKLRAFDEEGCYILTGQKEFERYNYQKITTFSELIRCWEKHNV